MIPEVRVRPYRTFGQRLRGLLGRPPPPAGTGVWIVPCGQVHTLGMRYAIDVVHLDEDGVVLTVERLAPWRAGAWVFGTASVVELAAGEAERLGLTAGCRPRLILDDA